MSLAAFLFDTTVTQITVVSLTASFLLRTSSAAVGGIQASSTTCLISVEKTAQNENVN